MKYIKRRFFIFEPRSKFYCRYYFFSSNTNQIRMFFIVNQPSKFYFLYFFFKSYQIRLFFIVSIWQIGHSFLFWSSTKNLASLIAFINSIPSFFGIQFVCFSWIYYRFVLKCKRRTNWGGNDRITHNAASTYTSTANKISALYSRATNRRPIFKCQRAKLRNFFESDK